MHGSEKRFSLGWFDEDYLNTCPVMLIKNPEGYIDAFANVVSEYQANEVSVDLMRHRHQANKGQMDFLFAALFEWAKQQGFATYNLGLSSLSGIGESATDPAIERAMHYVYEHVNQFYNFKGLHEFKSKFDPSWSPRYLIYPTMATLPATTLAIIRADSGSDLIGGYLKRPKEKKGNS
jgi:phosphatidylglycerol lysyltransferase